MNSILANFLYRICAPAISVTELDIDRFDAVRMIEVDAPSGLELGVAAGVYSEQVNKRVDFASYTGVDAFIGHHSDEYNKAAKVYGAIKGAQLIRATFDDFKRSGSCGMYDYVYIDGFAHTGEEGGKTISDFWVHLRMGGIIAGDDYHSDWPLVLWAVADFASKTGCSI